MGVRIFSPNLSLSGVPLDIIPDISSANLKLWAYFGDNDPGSLARNLAPKSFDFRVQGSPTVDALSATVTPANNERIYTGIIPVAGDHFCSAVVWLDQVLDDTWFLTNNGSTKSGGGTTSGTSPLYVDPGNTSDSIVALRAGTADGAGSFQSAGIGSITAPVGPYLVLSRFNAATGVYTVDNLTSLTSASSSALTGQTLGLQELLIGDRYSNRDAPARLGHISFWQRLPDATERATLAQQIRAYYSRRGASI